MATLEIDPIQYKYIRSIPWHEVFSLWRASEAGRENWILHYTAKGFKSWEEWRTAEIVNPLKLPEKDWALYKIISPLKIIPTFHGGRFKGWIERFYEGRRSPTFAELAEHKDIQNHSGINEILKNFPNGSMLIAVVRGNDVVIIEGMHRCSAIALAASRYINIRPNINIALSRIEGSD